jgi:uncharacterized membrane protein (UPF0127 family)
MVLEGFTYFSNGKKKKIKVKKVSVLSTGLMFRLSSPPLLFTLRKRKRFLISSIFCWPFRAIWLDENKRVLKTVDVNTWKWKIPGEGKYLLEIPRLPKNDKSSSRILGV